MMNKDKIEVAAGLIMNLLLICLLMICVVGCGYVLAMMEASLRGKSFYLCWLTSVLGLGVLFAAMLSGGAAMRRDMPNVAGLVMFGSLPFVAAFVFWPLLW